MFSVDEHINENYRDFFNWDDIGNKTKILSSNVTNVTNFFIFYFDSTYKEYYLLGCEKQINNEYIDDEDLKKKDLTDVFTKKTTFLLNFNKIFVVAEKYFNKIFDFSNINSKFFEYKNIMGSNKVMRDMKNYILMFNPNLSILRIYLTSKNKIGAKSLYLSNKKLKKYLNDHNKDLFNFKRFNFDERKYKKEDRFFHSNVNDNRKSHFQFEMDETKYNKLFLLSNNNFLKIIKLYSMNNIEFKQINFRYFKMIKICLNILNEYFPNDIKTFLVSQRKNLKGFENEINKIKNNLRKMKLSYNYFY